MNTLTHAAARPAPFRGALIRALRSTGQTIGTAVVLSQQSRARAARRATLLSLSDAQLADLGLSRDGINHHVYPELFGR